ncbi:hypothetical protein FMEAI12_5010005 [Parafrankia sp. Ea1.12]|nr:hypothetical protein FMEAI12_5010005 [Parafrankia sp. Ea1.12]
MPLLFCLPGGSYTKAYWHLEVPGRTGYSFGEHMAATACSSSLSITSPPARAPGTPEPPNSHPTSSRRRTRRHSPS